MAVLEAFVYDPLINWRLMQADPETRPPDRTSSGVLAEILQASNLCGHAAELRSQELTRVAAYPQGPLRKLKADENDIFNGGGPFHCGSNYAAEDPPLLFQRPKKRGTSARLRYTTGCRISLRVRTIIDYD